MAGSSGGASKRAANEPLTGPASKEKHSAPATSTNDYSVVIKGLSRSMRTYNPVLLNRNLCKMLGGNYADIKVLPSGDLYVRCETNGQMKKILACTDLGEHGKPIEVKVESFVLKPIEVKGVISNVPMDLSDEEIKEALTGQHVSFVKRMPYRSDKGVAPSRSVLLCFKSTILPAVVDIGYLRFRTRDYVPPTKRCYNCNRYGHLAKACRSAHRCTKCGGRHAYEDCATERPKCVNCGGTHSAGYAGCPRYRHESIVNSVMVKQKVNYWTAREMVRTSVSNQSTTPEITSFAEFPALPLSQYPSNNMFGQQMSNGYPVTQEKENEPRPKTAKVQQSGSVGHNTDEITIPTESFFSFIAEDIKNTLLTFSENKPLSVENIKAKSASTNLGIPCVWNTDVSAPQTFTGKCDQTSPMDLSRPTEPLSS